MAVLLPVLKVLAVVFRPVAKAWAAVSATVLAPMKRFWHRNLSRLMWWKKKEDVAARKDDEEAGEKTSKIVPRTARRTCPNYFDYDGLISADFSCCLNYCFSSP
jgi:hypothetical protein